MKKIFNYPVTVSARISESDKEHIEKICDESNQTRSEYLRDLIVEHLKSKNYGVNHGTTKVSC
jgi:predicted DNA-binding protein